MRILLVEDEKELSRALAQMLMKDGYDVDCVYDGADGLNFASTGMYDIVLLDAPCSADGTLRRHPEIVHTRTVADVRRSPSSCSPLSPTRGTRSKV